VICMHENAEKTLLDSVGDKGIQDRPLTWVWYPGGRGGRDNYVALIDMLCGL